MAEADREPSPKRGPEAPVQQSKESGGKRLPEYANREEEAIEEGFLTDVLTRGDTDKSINDGLAFLKQGTALLKYTRRNGIPHFKWVQLSQDLSYVRWFSKKKKKQQSTIKISEITEIIKGQNTEVFRRSKQPQLEVASFSIVYNDGKDTFDCVAKGQDECTLWVETLTAILEAKKKGEDVSKLTVIPTSVAFMDRYKMPNREHLLASATSKAVLAHYITKTLKSEIDKAGKKFKNITKKMTGLDGKHPDCLNISAVTSELDERTKSVSEMCQQETSEKIARSDVWRLNVDMDCILEKVEVSLKEC